LRWNGNARTKSHACLESAPRNSWVNVHWFPKAIWGRDEVAAAYRVQFFASEAVLFIGKAQEKVAVFRTENAPTRT